MNSPKPPDRRVAGRALIAGAGIGGLTAALALGRAGFEVALFERTAVLEEFGAGLQLTPNATRILAGLGALEACEVAPSRPARSAYCAGATAPACRRCRCEWRKARWRAPYLVIHRADLQRALVERIAREPNVELTPRRSKSAAWRAMRGGVTIGVKRGAIGLKERGDFLIGADGLRSIVRERLGLGGRDEAVFSGRVAFRAQVDPVLRSRSVGASPRSRCGSAPRRISFIIRCARAPSSISWR